MASLSLRVYQKIVPNVEFSILLENKKSKESLLFQAGTVCSLGQPETDAIRANHYGRIADAYGCLGILQVCPKISWEALCKIQEVDIISLEHMRPQTQKPVDEEPWLKELKKLLGNESFYFSVPVSGGDERPYDITLCAQRRASEAGTDNKFFWNRMLHLHLKRFGVDCDKWLIKAMCGSIEFSTLYMNNHTPKILIISRLSCERAGTRFNVRGVNDAGHVANFVETEQLIHIDSLNDLILSYIQIRGTVPLFWEQPGLNVGSHKVKMSREPEVSVQAFRKHMRSTRKKYGQQVVLNLLGTGVTGKRQGEAALSHLFQFQHLNCRWTKDSLHIVFDFHQECHGVGAEGLVAKLRPQISKEIDDFGFFCSRDGVVEQLQSGVMRTNCLDCLDRTNRVQTFLGLDIMMKMLEVVGVANNGVIVQRFSAKLDDMWKDNGNRISQNYAGTGALQGSKIIDGARSAARTIQNNLLDNSKQEAIDIILHGNLLNNYLATLSRTLLPHHYLYAPISILKETCERCPEYTEPFLLRVAVGTYNVNGGKHFRSLAYKHLSLDDWLLDSQKNEGKHSLIDTSPAEDEIDVLPPDIFAIGFEEIVDLTAQNIVQNTQWSENAQSWGRELKKVISRDQNYVMVTWKQLVGVALFVFVHERHAGQVRDISVETVKTGLQGATGNKGAVGVRMVIRNTSMAFICSHFAAGQKEVHERNSDYENIAKKLIFSLGIPLWAHDYVFWCGDFNYRINLGREEVMELIQRQEWNLLQEQDQLKISQKDGRCFKGFLEGEVNFPPTYKYDLFSDDYDTSEKARVPAWTDRVLFWKRKYPRDKNNPNWSPGRIIHYGRAELKQSDHRPVLAIVEVEGMTVIENRREEVYQSVVTSAGPTDCTVAVKMKDLASGEEIIDVLNADTMQEISTRMAEFGKIVLIRPFQESIMYTYTDSKMALIASELEYLTVGDYEFEVDLKTHNWYEQLQEELALCADTTVPLTSKEEDDLEFEEDLDTNLSLEGVMDQFYYDDQECDEPPEIIHPEPIKPARPAPPRPVMPSRPPPPRPSAPGVGSESPSVIRSEKVENFSTTEHLFDNSPEDYPEENIPTSLPSSIFSPTPPLVSNQMPSLESPIQNLGNNLYNGQEDEPPSPNHFRPISRDDLYPSPPLETPPVPPDDSTPTPPLTVSPPGCMDSPPAVPSRPLDAPPPSFPPHSAEESRPHAPPPTAISRPHAPPPTGQSRSHGPPPVESRPHAPPPTGVSRPHAPPPTDESKSHVHPPTVEPRPQAPPPLPIRALPPVPTRNLPPVPPRK